MGRARKLRALPLRECLILLQAWALLVAADVALRMLPSARVLAIPRRLLSSGRPPPAISDVDRLGWLVQVAARYTPLPATCLTQA
ncbi:MAG: lasso peptide biosynthesis protein, partial [Candidatus Rokuibacteriota bacterium]